MTSQSPDDEPRPRKVLHRKELARRSRLLQVAGKRVALTNGVFDVLHVGHVRYLQSAAEYADVLLVGVNTDSSVRKLKGPDRPVNCESDRVEIVAALECTTLVTLFDELTAEELVTEVRPDIYIKGGDYSADPADSRFPPEGHIVQRYGGSVCVIPYVPSRSTTDLIRRIRSGRQVDDLSM